MMVNESFEKWCLLWRRMSIEWPLGLLQRAEGLSDSVLDIEYPPFHTNFLHRWGWYELRRWRQLGRDYSWDSESEGILDGFIGPGGTSSVNQLVTEVVAEAPAILRKQGWTNVLSTSCPRFTRSRKEIHCWIVLTGWFYRLQTWSRRGFASRPRRL